MAKKQTTPPKKSKAPTTRKKNPHAVALGKLGGKKGGAARAKTLSSKRRKAIAKEAVERRWDREGPDANEIAKSILDHIIKTDSADNPSKE